MTDMPAHAGDAPRADAPQPLPTGWLSRWPWLTFVGPFVVYMLVGSLEPTPPGPSPLADQSTAVDPLADLQIEDALEPALEDDSPAGAASDEGWLPKLPYRYYPLVYTAKIVLTIAAMALVWPGYRTFPWRVSGLSLAVGIVGAVLWIVLAKLEHDAKPLEALGLDRFFGSGQRSAFNPLRYLADDPALAYGFLAIRLAGLAIIVPIIEEFLLRGFLMRFVVHDQWHQVPFGTATPLALAVGTVVPMLMHPGELAAAAVWFSLVSWLMVRTRSIWDCVVAHAVTNAMLGAYVLWSGDWWLM